MWGDPSIQAVIDCHARESDRLEALMVEVRDNAIPVRVTALGIAWHEWRLKLPVDPALSLNQRRDRILARYGGRELVAGTSWQADVNALIGGLGAWRYEEDSENFLITIFVPWPPGTEPFLALEHQVKLLPTWPCHLELDVQSEAGFILDQSELDNEAFHTD